MHAPQGSLPSHRWPKRTLCWEGLVQELLVFTPESLKVTSNSAGSGQGTSPTTGSLWESLEVRKKAIGLYKLPGQRPSGAQGQQPSISECSSSMKPLSLRHYSLTKKFENFCIACCDPCTLPPSLAYFYSSEVIGFCPMKHKSVALLCGGWKVKVTGNPNMHREAQVWPTLKTESTDFTAVCQGPACWRVPELPVSRPAGMWKEAGNRAPLGILGSPVYYFKCLCKEYERQKGPGCELPTTAPSTKTWQEVGKLQN